jgi:hypothetical protein
MENGDKVSYQEPQRLVECPGCGRRYMGRGLVGAYCLCCGDQLVEIAEERAEPLRNEPIVAVYRTSDLWQAEMVRELLESEDLMVALSGNSVVSVWPVTVDGVGEVGILALESDAERARAIIQEYLEQISAKGSSESEEEDE